MTHRQHHRPELALLYREQPTKVDGIRDYTKSLAEQLRALGVDVRVPAIPRQRGWLSADLLSNDAVVLQYQPFAWGRWGVAPGLMLTLAQLRARRRRPRIVLMVHETAMPPLDLKKTLMGLWQRMQLYLLRSMSDCVICSVGAWTRSLSRLRPLRPTAHLPVGSNVPDRRSDRASRRVALGADGRTVVVATLGGNHPSRLFSHIREALRALSVSGLPVMWIDLGPGTGDRLADCGLALRQVGVVSLTELGGWLAASDLLLAPFRDGASTRRGSIMAGLCNGVAVVSTAGTTTDPIMSDATDAIALTPADNPWAYAQLSLDLAADPIRRRRLAAAGRGLYDVAFAWPNVARGLLSVCFDHEASGKPLATTKGVARPDLHRENG